MDERLPKRIQDKIQIDNTGTGCWMWTAGTNGCGYGLVGWGGRAGGMVYAHRLIYELLIGPIPPGLHMDHLCRVTLCVNPGHLEPVTQRENNLRGVGASAVNAKKTHCPQGHEYDLVDGVNKRTRRCHECRLAAGRARYAADPESNLAKQAERRDANRALGLTATGQPRKRKIYKTNL